MTKIYILLLSSFLINGNIYSQQWIWSKTVHQYPGFYLREFKTTSNGEHYFLYRSENYMPPKNSILIHYDSYLNILDSLFLNLDVATFYVDTHGNLLMRGFFYDSLTYEGTTIHSMGQQDEFLIMVKPGGTLQFLIGFGTETYEGNIAGIAVDSADKIFIIKDVSNTIFIGNDSITYDEDFKEIALIVLNEDGSLNTFKKVIMTIGSCYCSYQPAGIFFSKTGEIYMKVQHSYPNEIDDYIVHINSDLDSINRFLGFTVDESGKHSYYLTNPGSHYWWEPILNKYNIEQHSLKWSKPLGGSYEYYLLSPLYLPGNLILVYGRGGNSYHDEPGSAIIGDSTFYFDGADEMLFAFIDTNGHFYYIGNEKVPGTKFISSQYDDHGFAYLLSSWNKDTSYTMGTSFTTNAGDLVLSKLNYSGLSTEIPERKSDDQFKIYPNPSSGKFTLVLSYRTERSRSAVEGQSSETISSISITNLIGIKIYSSNFIIHHTTFELDISSQPSGIYFLDIEINGIKERQKIIKK